jgi:predicted transcriptional regulator
MIVFAHMTIQEKVLEAIKDLPDEAEIEDAMERLFFLAKVERGISQADSGDTLSHEDVKSRMSKWLT